MHLSHLLLLLIVLLYQASLHFQYRLAGKAKKICSVGSIAGKGYALKGVFQAPCRQEKLLSLVSTFSDLFRGGEEPGDIPPDWLPPPVVNFKIFLGEHAPRPPSLSMLLLAIISPLYRKILYKTKDINGHIH